MKIRELTNDEFRNFAQKYNIKSIYQTVEYALIMKTQNFDSYYLGLVNDDNQILGATLVLIEKKSNFKYGYAPRGFLIDYSNENLVKTFTEEIKRYLGKQNVIAIKLNPMIIKSTYDLKHNVMTKNNYFNHTFDFLKKLGYHHLGFNNFFEALKPRYEAIINLNLPYYILFQNINKKFRTKIRSAERRGIQVYKGKEEELEYLYLQTKNKYPRDLQYFKECYRYWKLHHNIDFYYTKLNTEQYVKVCQKEYNQQETAVANITIEMNKAKTAEEKAKLVTIKMEEDKKLFDTKKALMQATKLLRDYPNGIVTSSILVIKYEDTIYLLMDGYHPKFKVFNSKHLLIWKLMEKYSKEGYKFFNLGGISAVNLVNNPYQGLNRFKLNFNALGVEYIGDLELITNNALYFMYKNSIAFKSILKK